MRKSVTLLLSVLVLLWVSMGLWWAGVHVAGQLALTLATAILAVAPPALVLLVLFYLFRRLTRRPVKAR